MPKLLLLLLISVQVSKADNDSYLFKVRIPEVQGSHGPLVQRGFKLDGTPGVITTLHGVCTLHQTFEVSDGKGGLFRHVRLYWADFANDLAMIGNEELFKLKGGFRAPVPLKVAPSEACEAWGLPLGEFDWKKPVTLADPPLYTLKTRVTGSLLELLDKRASPSLDIQVLGLDGAITPGYSGAPLIRKATGEVLGIVDGGILQETNIAWAIPISNFQWEDPRKDSKSELRLQRLSSMPTSHLFRTIDRAAIDDKERDQERLLLGTWNLIKIDLGPGKGPTKQSEAKGYLRIFRDPTNGAFKATADFTVVEEDSSPVPMLALSLKAKFENASLTVKQSEVKDGLPSARVNTSFTTQLLRIQRPEKSDQPVTRTGFSLNFFSGNWYNENRLNAIFAGPDFSGKQDEKLTSLIFERGAD